MTTTTIATVRATPGRPGLARVARRVAEALEERIVAWSARYIDEGLAERLEALPAERRMDAALRWHARQRRIV
ncbi:MAG TPA: hypothetical protein VFM93_01615 [Candidatus Limnocylindria bacterium]|nr:hypothetical protein [Candidatus Limnocylindria bacterium]